jgi:Septum formation
MSSSMLRLLAVLVVLTALVGACATDDDPGDVVAGEGTTTSTSPDTSSSSTTTPAPRALVVPRTVSPLLSSTTTAPTSSDTISLDDLSVGDCVDIADAEPGAVEVGTARRRDCAEPHGLEVFHVGSLNDDQAAPYPGDEAILAAADQMCLDAFTPYVGIAYVDSTFEIAHLRPDQNVWLHGDRIVRCVAQDRSLEPLVGTVKDSAR